MHLVSTSVTLCLALAATVLARTNQEPTGPTVETQNGTVVGRYVESYNQEQFLGIPFAQPPVGNLRFNLPQPVNDSWDTPFDAREYGTVCTNYLLDLEVDIPGLKSSSEDCLTLNIVRPANATTTPDECLPVLVYIFGGGFRQGGSADGQYNTSRPVQHSVDMGAPSIVVTMNYRVHGWGYLAGDVVRGQGALNVGLYDQRLALRWIQENIDAFGGDRERVTIHGESAGAASVGFHLLAYSGRDDGLFHAAICQSGGPWYFGSFATYQESEQSYQAVIRATNCTEAEDTLACLRAAPFEALDAAFASLSFLPVVDGLLIPRYNSLALADGKFVRVPMLIGANTDEGKIFTFEGPNSSKDFASVIANYTYVRTKHNATIARLLDAYPYPGSNTTHGQSNDQLSLPAAYGSQFLRTARYTGDAMFIAGRRYTCEVWAQHGVPCYSFRFNTIPAGLDPVTSGATHAQEVAFVFNNQQGLGMVSNPFNVTPPARQQRYKELATPMGRMWMSFVATQSPNHHQVESFKTLWDPYSLADPRNMVFDGNTTSYIEKDDWRVEPIRLIIDSAAAFSR
ncbi:hypothetical protein BDW74DRAFT_184917 [Aspergillus multicolor]|uniref:uncharacterized protein n=1 Tax=Aspergillus multicolor TaxID=41759 RepID=UPI003CCD9F2C